MDLCEVTQQLRKFAHARDWEQYHTARNVMLALVGEVGELAEHFQWRTDTDIDGMTSEQKSAVGEELADVLSYLVMLADAIDVDLSAAFTAKMAANDAKYPADQVRGSNAKYIAYQRPSTSSEHP